MYRTGDPQGDERLRELILFIAEECTDDPLFGATKLNKILWWSDFLAYAEHGEPITGVEYQRLGNGPAPRRLVPVRAEMVDAGDAAIADVPTLGGRVRQRLVPLRAPNLDVFTSTQIALVNRVINTLWRKNAKGVSALSHGKAWEVTADRESIPYEAVFLSDARINRYDVARTKELAAKFGWAKA